ncbi:hypothetical protein DFJ63DRAFT_153972 [Scheffersomyces coipomensis]|uniref:uncharacterized protein n=1 Tax=Scheffersomyces coipomensis TaxID=1788519 RepID=UPI00315DF2B3
MSINRVQLSKCMGFLVDKYDQEDFNLFNCISFEELNDPNAPVLLQQIMDGAEGNDFELEKMKLSFIISNFISFCGLSDSPINRLTNAYLSSEKYIQDFKSLIKEAVTQIGSIIYEMVQDVRGRHMPPIEYFYSCFAASQMWFTSFPAFAIEDAQITNTRINYSRSRRYFATFCQVFPTSIDSSDDELKIKLANVSLKVRTLNESTLSKNLVLVRPQNEAQLEDMFGNLISNNIVELLSSNFDSASKLPQDNSSGIVRPDLGIEVTKNGINYTVPVEFKYSGLRYAFNAVDNIEVPFSDLNSSFRELFNQSIYQLLTYKSELGFVIDRSSVYIVKIKSPRVLTQMMNQGDGSNIRVIDCVVSCLEHSTNGNSLGSILTAYLLDYFTGITNERTAKIDTLFRSFKLSDVQKREMVRRKQVFMLRQWVNRFLHYRLERGFYVHTIYNAIKIPREIFEITNLIKEWNVRNESELTIGRNLRQEEPLEKHFSKVFSCKIGDSDTEVVLKVYDAIGAPILNNKSGLSDQLFFEVYSYVTEMFLCELNSYLTIRGDPRGLDEEPPSSGGNGSLNGLLNINCTPYLYEYGFFAGVSFSGFYLIQQFISDDKLQCDFEHFSTLAKISLSHIHSIGLIHGDIHPYNMIYNRERDRVYYIDFGKSTFTNFQRGERSVAADWLHLERALVEIRNLRN